METLVNSMENRYANLINEFESNVRKLISEHKALRDENENLAAELERKREDLMKAHKEILDLRKEYTLLQTANGLGGSDENRQFSRKHLNKIVREIDKCLALLSE
ncbi:MAG: hypothetical protein KBG43_01405 [Paludibacteraceae bacterium]|nr:hypothetical protein [Paludibacteraceae bacterium]